MNRKQVWSCCLIVVVALVVGAGCGSTHPEIESLTLSKTTVAPGDTLDVTLKVKNFKIEAHGGHDHSEGDSTMAGHYHIYFDTNASPVAMATSETHTLTIPDTMTEGEHKLRVELVTADHTTLNPAVKQETTFMVKK